MSNEQQPGSFPPPPGAIPPPNAYAPQPGVTPPPAGAYPPAPGGYPAPGAYGAPAGYGAPQYAPAPPARVTVNPFKGVPVGDVTRDALASLLLLLSLALPWSDLGLTWADDARDRSLIEVLLVVLLTAVAAWLPYLGRAGFFPPTWTVAQTRLLRLGIAAPYVLLVLVYVVLGLIQTFSKEPSNAGLALSSAQMLGLAGVALIATPRTIDLDSEYAVAKERKLWKTVLSGLAGTAAVGALLTIVLIFVEPQKQEIFGYSTGSPTSLKIFGLISVLVSLAVVGGALGLVVLRDSIAWRRTLVVVATSLLVIAFFGLDENSGLPRIEGALFGANPLNIIGVLSLVGGFGLFLIPAAAVIALSPVLHGKVAPEHQVAQWVETATNTLWVLAAAGVATVVTGIGQIVVKDDLGLDKITGKAITTIVLGLLIAAVAGYAAYAATQRSPQARILAFAAAGAAVVLGIVVLVMAPEIGGDKLVTFGVIFLAFALPAAIAGIYLVPKPVREFAASQRAAAFAAAGYGVQGGYAPAPGYPAPQQYAAAPGAPVAPAPVAPAPVAPAPVAGTGFTAEQAADPATPAAVLAQIAAEAPHLRPAVASNPAAYPDLLTWLSQLGDPAVDAAIAARPASQ